MADVFLSYTHTDQPIAERLAHRLTTLGWSVWWDRQLLSGDNYRTEIQRQLDDARCVLVLWSNGALTSRWVNDEAEEGVKNGRLVQVTLEGLVPPLGFRSVQYVSQASPGADLGDEVFGHLAEAIAKKVPPTAADRFTPASIKTTTALKEALDSLVLRAPQDDPAQGRLLVQQLEAEFAGKWSVIGSVNESFGRAWASLGDAPRAATYFEGAINAPDGSATFSALEQLANLRIRLAFRNFFAETSAAVDTEGRRTSDALARESIHEGIALLDRLRGVRTADTAEALTGNAYKRLAILESVSGSKTREAAALAKMEQHYAAAEAIGVERHAGSLYYVTLNKMAARLARPVRGKSQRRLDAGDIQRVRTELNTLNKDKPDFWSIVAAVELSLYEAVDAGALTERESAIVEAYRDLQRRVQSPRMWASVYDAAFFLLTRYSRRASPKEQRAAGVILEALKDAAQPH
jgi:hypothetical protein